MHLWLDIAIVTLAILGALAYTWRWLKRARRGAQSSGCGTSTSCRCPKSAVASELDAGKRRVTRS